MCLKKLVDGYAESWSKHVAQHNWISFEHNILVVFSDVFAMFLQISFSLQKETKMKNLDPLLTQRGLILDQFLTLQHIYICIHTLSLSLL